MFYQLKITRKGTKPPVWRRCTVAADVTFAKMAAMLEKLNFFRKKYRSVRTVTEKRRIISHY